VTRAHDLGVAALLGDSIYNFGELVSSGPRPPRRFKLRQVRTTELILARVGAAATSDPQSARRIAVRVDQGPALCVQRGRSGKVRYPAGQVGRGG
jgi:hypothetical protein